MKSERTAIRVPGWVTLALWSPLFVAGSLAAAPSNASQQAAPVNPVNKEAKAAAIKVAQEPAQAVAATAAQAQITEPIHDLNLQPNQQQILDFQPISQVALVNPAVADFVLVGPSTMVLTAKQVGETLLFVTHGRQRRTIFRINVLPPPSPDLQQLAAQVQASINRPEITVRTVGKSLLIEGEVADQAELERVTAIVKAFGVEAQNLLRIRPTVAPTQVAPAEQAVQALQQAIGLTNVTIRAIGPATVAIEGKLANQAEVERVRALVAAIAKNVQVVDLLVAPAPEPRTVRQVLIRARVVEINKTAMKSLGSEFGSSVLGSGGAVISPTFSWAQAGAGPFEDIFGGGEFFRLNPLGFKISALINEGAGKVLSEPNIVVLEGQRGNILVGGEFPYLAAVTTGGTSAGGQPLATVEFKTFGIQLTVEPRVINEDDVTLRVVPEVSLPDFSRSVSVGGSVVPPLSTRHAETIVRLQNGQTMAIGGLLQDDYTLNVTRFPYLSRIPVLGEFFRKRDVDRTQSELVILLTPEILGPGQVPSTPAPPTEIRRPQVPVIRNYHD